MREIIFKYKLKNKQDNEILIQYVPLYNEMNGIIQFPIELDKWEVLDIKQRLNIKDIYDKFICEGDKLKFKSYLYHKKEFEGIVIWNNITNSFIIDRGINSGFSFNADIFDIEIIG